MLSMCTKMFRYEACKYQKEKEKINAARLVIEREFGIMNSFTIEASFYAFIDKDRKSIEFTVDHYERMGRYICETLWKYMNLLEEEKINKLHHNYRKKKIAQSVYRNSKKNILVPNNPIKIENDITVNNIKKNYKLCDIYESIKRDIGHIDEDSNDSDSNESEPEGELNNKEKENKTLNLILSVVDKFNKDDIKPKNEYTQQIVVKKCRNSTSGRKYLTKKRHNITMKKSIEIKPDPITINMKQFDYAMNVSSLTSSNKCPAIFPISTSYDINPNSNIGQVMEVTSINLKNSYNNCRLPSLLPIHHRSFAFYKNRNNKQGLGTSYYQNNIIHEKRAVDNNKGNENLSNPMHNPILLEKDKVRKLYNSSKKRNAKFKDYEDAKMFNLAYNMICQSKEPPDNRPIFGNGTELLENIKNFPILTKREPGTFFLMNHLMLLLKKRVNLRLGHLLNLSQFITRHV